MTAKDRPVAMAFPPGDIIREELEARGWTQSDLANVLGRPFQTVNSIVNGRKSIQPRMAVELAAAFGTSAEFWMNLEISYQLYKESEPDPEIAVRAQERDRSAASTSRHRLAAAPHS
jgi:HTH-type transcriptional regulator / antitoxin HigA